MIKTEAGAGLAIGLVPLLGLTLVLAACREEKSALEFPPTTADAFQGCAVCYTHSYSQGGSKGFGSATSEKTLNELAALGMRSISVASFGWMPSVKETSVSYSGGNKERLIKVAANARARGMTVIYRAQLWISGGVWVAEIQPDPAQGGWDKWFDSYEKFLLDNAAVAQLSRAERMVIGVELRSAVKARPQRWRAMIKKVRGLYSGQLIYSAVYDSAEAVSFWADLDFIGINMYAPLTKSSAPSQTEVDAEATRWLRRYEALSARIGKPLLLTEAGFPNYEGSLKTPYQWASQAGVTVATPKGDLAQKMGYRALLSTFGRSAAVKRIYWWKWFSNPDSQEEGPVGYWPRAKPAEALLKTACAKIEQ